MHLKWLNLVFLTAIAVPQADFNYPDVPEADEIPETSLETISEMADQPDYPDSTYDVNDNVTEEEAYADDIQDQGLETDLDVEEMDEIFQTTAETVTEEPIPYTPVDADSLEKPASSSSYLVHSMVVGLIVFIL